MSYLTIVTPQPESDFDMWIKKSHPAIEIKNRQIIDDRAVCWAIGEALSKQTLNQIRQEFRVDLFQTTTKPDIKLFIADMDSTIVSGETLDDMAATAGIGEKIADITARAMRGELDFKNALRERIAMLRGHPASLIDHALFELKLNPGAELLLKHLKAQGVYCVLVSGGFTPFTSYVADKLGFDAHFGNELIVGPVETDGGLPFLGQITPLVNDPADFILTGEVGEPILDKNFKLQKLQELQKKMNLQSDQIISIGDGANDLPMLEAVELGIGYYGKPLLREALINRVDYTDLASLTYLVT